MKVDMQSMDWQTLVSRRARKDPPDKGGWNAFLTSSASVDIVDPLANTYINAVGENAWFGWPKDDELVKLRAAFADETDEAKRKEIAEAMQVRVSENPTHIFARPVVRAGGDAQEHHRQPRIAGDDLLEHREEVTAPRSPSAGAVMRVALKGRAPES